MPVYKGINPLASLQSEFVIYDLDAISASYYNLLSNSKGEVLFEPQLGFNLIELLYHEADERKLELYQKKLTIYLNTNEPRAKVSSTRLSYSNGSLDILITWSPYQNNLRTTGTIDTSFTFN